MKKSIVTISELVELGYPRKAIERACHSIYGNMFCHKLNENKKTSKYMIRLEKFEQLWDRGVFARED